MNIPFGYEIERSSSVRELPERSRAENVLFSGERDRGLKIVSQWTPQIETVIGGWNGHLAWWALPGGELVAERQLSKAIVAAAAFSPDAGTLPLDPPPEPAATEPGTLPPLLEGVSRLP